MFDVPLQTSLLYGWTTSAFGVVASVACALLHRQGRPETLVHRRLPARRGPAGRAHRCSAPPPPSRSWSAPPIAYAILQTIAFSLYLYSAELYPTRLRAIGTGFGSAWLRAGSSIGPVLVGFIVAGVGIQYVFVLFAVIAVIGGLTTKFFGIETKGKVLEELSP